MASSWCYLGNCYTPALKYVGVPFCTRGKNLERWTNFNLGRFHSGFEPRSVSELKDADSLHECVLSA